MLLDIRAGDVCGVLKKGPNATKRAGDVLENISIKLICLFDMLVSKYRRW